MGTMSLLVLLTFLVGFEFESLILLMGLICCCRALYMAIVHWKVVSPAKWTRKVQALLDPVSYHEFRRTTGSPPVQPEVIMH